MTKEQEFRKQTEEAKFEAFSFMCKKVADLEKENAELRKYEEQLTKARICLEQLVSEITVGELEVDPNILQQAEQFISEVEKC